MNSTGFTILEVLLSIAIIAVVGVFSLPIIQPLQNRNDLDNTQSAVIESLHRSRMLSRAVDGDISWGVKIQNGSTVIFKGASYAGRDTNYDEIFEVNPNFVISGLGEIVFAKFTGLPNTTGTIIITGTNNETRNITINSKGMVSY